MSEEKLNYKAQVPDDRYVVSDIEANMTAQGESNGQGTDYSTHERLYDTLGNIIDAVDAKQHDLRAQHDEAFKQHFSDYMNSSDEVHPEIEELEDCRKKIEQGYAAMDSDNMNNFHDFYAQAVEAYKKISQNYDAEGKHV